MKKLLAVFALAVLCRVALAQTTHKFGALDTNNSWTGSNTYLGSVYLSSLSGGITQCLHVLASGLVTGTGADCGSGGGGGGSMTWPGSAGIAVYSGSSSWGTSLAAPAGTIVGTTDTQTLTNKTVDGVSPTVFGYLDATSSIQTQLNGKASSSAGTTINTILCQLGSTCSLPFQVIGTNTLNQALLNFINSTANSVGLTITASNPSGGQVKFEITGSSYTGNAATATGIQTNGTNGQYWTMTSGSTQGWATFVGMTNPMLNIGEMIGGGTSGTPTRIPAGLTGQSIVATNSATPAFASPGIPSRTVTTNSDSILCDSGTALQDRQKLITYNYSSAVAVTVPDAGSSGCGGNFFFAVENQGAGSVTFTRTTSSTFTTFNGSAVSSGVTSFSLSQGQFAIVTSPDNANYQVRITTGGGGSGVSSFTGDGTLISNSGSTGAVTVTLGNAAAHSYWGNNTGSTGAAGYHALGLSDMPNFPATYYVPAANCNNTTAGAGMSLPASSAPTVACRTGTNVNTGVLEFTAASQTAQFQIEIPADANLSGTVYARALYTQGNANGSQTLTLQIGSGCGATDDAAFNTLQSFSSSTTGTTANTQYQATLSGLTTTGCTAGQMMNVKLSSSSVGTNQIWLQGIAITFPIAPVIQAN